MVFFGVIKSDILLNFSESAIRADISMIKYSIRTFLSKGASLESAYKIGEIKSTDRNSSR